MNPFIPLAKKYRPTSFAQVIGQNNITNTLKNTVETKQIGHAYLFAGPRGSGKTTCARIFAKSINCLNQTNGQACDNCISCINFSEGRSFNIIELDAASNNSVQDIRNIIEKAQYKPQTGNYKIYILDEAHMLSHQALNAFLKILEEPPRHIVFILATTEKQKIIPTILSRCQVFSFNKIKNSDIAQQLKHIAEQENIIIDNESLNIVADKADGALRDAIIIFEQISLSLNKKVTYQDVIEKLNIIDVNYFSEIFNNIIEKKLNLIIENYNNLLNKGAKPEDIVIGVIKYLRKLLLYKNTTLMLSTSNYYTDQLAKHSTAATYNFIIEGLKLSTKVLENMAASRNLSLYAELYLINLYNLYQTNDNNSKIYPSTQEFIDPTYPPANNTVAKVASIKSTNTNIDIVETKDSNVSDNSTALSPFLKGNSNSDSNEIIMNLKKEFKDPKISSIINDSTIVIDNNKIDIELEYTISKELKTYINDQIKQLTKLTTVNIYTKKVDTTNTNIKPILYTTEEKIEYFKQKHSDKNDILTKFISALKLVPLKKT